VDYRLVAVIVGLSVIVGDNLWRHHGRGAPATTEAAVPVPSPPPVPAPEALPLPDKPSIAVLPFDNLSGDPAWTQVGSWPDEAVGFGQHHPGACIIQAQSRLVAQGISTPCRGLGGRERVIGSTVTTVSFASPATVRTIAQGRSLTTCCWPRACPAADR
jgi:hypothetical protein